MSDTNAELPYGWVREFDGKSNHPFWVDTKAEPPRAIWTHPYEDTQFLSEHPGLREKLQGQKPRPPSNRRHSHPGQKQSIHPTNPAKPEKQGFFSKLKDKAIGTKEQREAERAAERQQLAMLQERRRQQRLSAQAAYGYGNQSQGLYGQGYANRYAAPMGYAPQRQRRGGMGMGLPLAGGLAGGLLLGSALDGGFGGGYGGDYGGDYGGGDYGGGGGDFGGGDFGGGGGF